MYEGVEAIWMRCLLLHAQQRSQQMANALKHGQRCASDLHCMQLHQITHLAVALGGIGAWALLLVGTKC